MITSSIVSRIIRTSLETGQSVEIEGLGRFEKNPSGIYSFIPELQPRIFIAYAIEDLEQVRRLSARLRSAACSPWLDKEKLIAGQNWPRAIERAIETADGFVACFSPRSVVKHGQFQSELRYALDCARRLPLDQVFLIPVRLERCPVPARIADHVQYVDLFPDWDKGIKKLLRAIRSIPRRPGIQLRTNSAAADRAPAARRRNEVIELPRRRA